VTTLNPSLKVISIAINALAIIVTSVLIIAWLVYTLSAWQPDNLPFWGLVIFLLASLVADAIYLTWLTRGILVEARRKNIYRPIHWLSILFWLMIVVSYDLLFWVFYPLIDSNL
jgi:hypothetical protein